MTEQTMDVQIAEGFTMLTAGMTKVGTAIDGVRATLDSWTAPMSEEAANKVRRLMATFDGQIAECRRQVRSVAAMGPEYTEKCDELFQLIDSVTVKASGVLRQIQELRSR